MSAISVEVFEPMLQPQVCIKNSLLNSNVLCFRIRDSILSGILLLLFFMSLFVSIAACEFSAFWTSSMASLRGVFIYIDATSIATRYAVCGGFVFYNLRIKSVVLMH